VNNFAGDTAEKELLTSRKTLSPHYNGAVFELVTFFQNALGHRGAVAKGGTNRDIMRVEASSD